MSISNSDSATGGGRSWARAAARLVGLLTATILAPLPAFGQTGAADLTLVNVGSDERSFHVVATIVVGPSESIVWDAQYRVSGGERLAEMVKETGTTLKAIVLSHADHDHYMGAMAVIEQFPGTPVYMTQAGLDDFLSRSQEDWAYEKRRGPDPEVPEKLPDPQLLPSNRLLVDGHEVVVIEGLTGDVRGAANAALWIPSINAVLTGDVVFEGIHPWLGDSDIESRKAWRASLRQLAALEPQTVVPGHKRDMSEPDSPAQIDFMLHYLERYDEAMSHASTPEELIQVMTSEYPDLVLPGLMAYGAKKWFKQ